MNGFFHEWWHILSDPAHLAAELSFMLLIDVLFLGLLVPLFRKWVRREHAKIDREHGYENHAPVRSTLRRTVYHDQLD